MAQGNPFNGMLRGRIGDTIFSRKNGQQQSRAHVSSPANPQTDAQMGQRVKFATCASFYSQGLKAFFKFAFENKSKDMTDYNAFLRANMERVPANSWLANKGHMPTPGYFIMTDGSLPSIEVLFDGEVEDFKGASISYDESLKIDGDTTMGDIYQGIIDTYGLQAGDILTIVGIRTQGELATSLEVAENWGALARPVSSNYPTWEVKQVILDPKATGSLATSKMFHTEFENNGYLRLRLTLDSDSDLMQAACVCVSRNTPSGLKVSRSVLRLNSAGNVAEDFAQDEAWWRFCVQSYKKADSLPNLPGAILEGSEL